MFDDLTVLGGLSLQQLLDHHHTLGHHSLCKDDTADVRTKFKPRASQFSAADQSAVTFTQRYNALVFLKTRYVTKKMYLM